MRTIVIDTREKRPWAFPEWAKTRIGTLATGDYALEGDESFAIERKSLDDFLGTVFGQWARFQRELQRMDGWVAKVIVVEANLAQFCFREQAGCVVAPEHSHSKISPKAVLARLAELTFMGVTVIFGGTADMSAAVAYSLLCQRNAMLEKEALHE